MTRDEVHLFFGRRQQAWTARDPDALTRTHAEDGTVVSPMFGMVQGRPRIAETYRALFDAFRDWEYVADELIVDGDRVAEAFTVRATHSGDFMGIAGTGRRFEVQGVLLFVMRDGLIGSERRVYDFTGLLIQIGVLRGRPAQG